MNAFLQVHRVELLLALAAAGVVAFIALAKRTHAVLAYAYSVGDSYYSGQIRLRAGEHSMDSLAKELTGLQISVRYDPNRPEVSIFLKHKVRGWPVVEDRRLSISAWIDNLS